MAGSLQKFVQEGKGCTFSWDSLSSSLSSLGATFIGKNLLPWEQILFFKSNPQIRSDIVSVIKVKNKNTFYLSEGMKNCEMSGKSEGILRWMISGNPCTNLRAVSWHDWNIGRQLNNIDLRNRLYFKASFFFFLLGNLMNKHPSVLFDQLRCWTSKTSNFWWVVLLGDTCTLKADLHTSSD